MKFYDANDLLIILMLVVRDELITIFNGLVRVKGGLIFKL